MAAIFNSLCCLSRTTCYAIAHAQYAVEPTYLPCGSFAIKNPSAASQVLVVVQVFELELELEEEVHFVVLLILS